jgi:hypothetical protein
VESQADIYTSWGLFQASFFTKDPRVLPLTIMYYSYHTLLHKEFIDRSTSRRESPCINLASIPDLGRHTYQAVAFSYRPINGIVANIIYFVEWGCCKSNFTPSQLLTARFSSPTASTDLRVCTYVDVSSHG